MAQKRHTTSLPLTEERFLSFMHSFQDGMREEFAMKDDFRRLEAQVEKLTNSIDTYVRTTESWHQEQIVLRSRVDRLVATLRKRGLIKEEDLAL